MNKENQLIFVKHILENIKKRRGFLQKPDKKGIRKKQTKTICDC